MLSLADDIRGPRGRLEFVVRRGGRVIESFCENNLVVDASKLPLSRLVGGSVAGQSITSIAFGTNGVAPAAGNTTITAPFTKAVDSVEYPATNQVKFNFSLSSTEANGMSISEFGLLTGGGTLFARKTRAAALAKDSDLSLTGSWTLTF